MSKFLEQYLREHPEYKVLKDLDMENRKILLWARVKGFIPKTHAPDGSVIFTDDELDRAKMWNEKVGKMVKTVRELTEEDISKICYGRCCGDCQLHSEERLPGDTGCCAVTLKSQAQGDYLDRQVQVIGE